MNIRRKGLRDLDLVCGLASCAPYATVTGPVSRKPDMVTSAGNDPKL